MLKAEQSGNTDILQMASYSSEKFLLGMHSPRALVTQDGKKSLLVHCSSHCHAETALFRKKRKEKTTPFCID